MKSSATEAAVASPQAWLLELWEERKRRNARYSLRALAKALGLSAATQREPQFPTERRYTINEDAWEKLDNNAKAGLILHEIIYTDAIAAGHINSRAARYFSAHLSSASADGTTPDDYRDLLVSMKLPGTLMSHGFSLDYASVIFWNGSVVGDLRVMRGAIQSGYYNRMGEKIVNARKGTQFEIVHFGDEPDAPEVKLVFTGSESLPDDNISLSIRALDHTSGWQVIGDSGVVFDLPSGDLHAIYPPLDRDVKITASGYFAGQTVNIEQSREIVEFHPGTLVPKMLHGSSFLIETEMNGRVNFKNFVMFHPNGKLQRGILDGDRMLRNARARTLYEDGEELLFDESGVLQ